MMDRWKAKKKGSHVTNHRSPRNYGLFGKPTTINNTETYASVPAIIRNGAEWFSNLARQTMAGQKYSRCRVR